MSESSTADLAILHIIVVEFHHKKGCQVEFAYPAFSEEHGTHSNYLPKAWKHLPSLALPDGSHNYTQDSCFFHLPPRAAYNNQTTVYGVSCYRQVAADTLAVKSKDVTRGSVQKSVVALSQMPLYNFLNANLEFAAEAFFKEDFVNKDVLIEFFHHMNTSFNKTNLSHKILSLSPKPLVSKFQQKILMLFKLILLERKVLVFASPVKKLVETILGILSLFPLMVERGLNKCTVTQDHACYTFGPHDDITATAKEGDSHIQSSTSSRKLAQHHSLKYRYLIPMELVPLSWKLKILM
jgi:hypothetical protein